jgi:hypothetical protein
MKRLIVALMGIVFAGGIAFPACGGSGNANIDTQVAGPGTGIGGAMGSGGSLGSGGYLGSGGTLGSGGSLGSRRDLRRMEERDGGRQQPGYARPARPDE